MPHQIIFREQYGPTGPEVVYIKLPDQKVVVPLHSPVPEGLASSLRGTLKNFLYDVFLPQGYPESVSKDYSSYQLWDTLQALCSSLNGTMTTEAIMKGVGVGNQASTPLAAAVTWILKDGSGNIGRIVFAWWKGTSLDADCKKWRLCADVLNDFAMFLELLLPYFTGYSTVLLCASTILKSIVGVAGGATRAALTQHQAIRDNMADVSAKDGSQETCVNLLASCIGIILLTSLGNLRYTWIMFAIFTSTHIYANYRAVKALTISTLNRARLDIVIGSYLENERILNPDIANQREAVVLGQGISAQEICGHDILIGETVSTFVGSAALTVDRLQVLHHLHQHHDYMLIPLEKQKQIFILLKEGVPANSSEVVKAYFHAVLLGIALNMTGVLDTAEVSGDPKLDRGGSSLNGKLKQVLRDTCSSTSKPGLEESPQLSSINGIIASIQVESLESRRFLAELCNAGWASTGHHLGSNEWRFKWSLSANSGKKS